MAPAVYQKGGFVLQALVNPSFENHNPKAFARQRSEEISYAVLEALSWLCHQGLLIREPQSPWYRLSRRGLKLKTRHDLEAFQKGRILPFELLQPELAEKVHHLFLRGDYETAV